MENNEMQSSLKISEMWEIFISHFWQIILVAFLAFVLLFVYCAVTYVPEYESISTIYILPRSEGKDISTVDLSIAINTVHDCTEILTSNKVFSEVKEELNLVDRIDYETFKSMISITNKEDSRVLYISVTAPTPTDAKLIVDALCDIGAEQIVEIMGVDQVNLVDYGTFNEQPSNSRFSKLSILAGIAAAIVTYCIYLALYVVDDNINTPDDVEKYLNVSILGVIPDYNDAASNKRHGGRYGKYGVYGQVPEKTQNKQKEG